MRLVQVQLALLAMKTSILMVQHVQLVPPTVNHVQVLAVIQTVAALVSFIHLAHVLLVVPTVIHVQAIRSVASKDVKLASTQ